MRLAVLVASCVSTPGPSTQAWSVAWFISMTPSPPVAVIVFSSFSTLAGGSGPATWFCFIRVALKDKSDRLVFGGIVQVERFSGRILAFGFSFGGILVNGDGAPQPSLADFRLLIAQKTVG